MELTLNELLAGKACRIKNKEYFPTAAYVEPFLERVHNVTNNFIIRAEKPSQITYNLDKGITTENITWNRFWVQAILNDKENCFENHQKSINLLVALDTRKPLVKIFKNDINMACLNMCVFSPDYLNIQPLEPETSINFRPVDDIIKLTDETNKILTKFSNTFIKRSKMLEQLGLWIDNCINKDFSNGYGRIKIATSTPIDAYKQLLYIEDSPYYQGNQDEINYFDIYNSFTDLICNDKDKDIVNKYEKCYLLNKILNI